MEHGRAGEKRDVGIKSMKKGGGDKVTHAQFADDTILFGQGCMEEIVNYKTLLWSFERASSLKLNVKKYKLFTIGVEEEEESVRIQINLGLKEELSL